MRQALLDIGDNVRTNEPGTVDFYVSQDPKTHCVSTTCERFTDQAALDTHDNSATVARFFGIARPILASDILLVIAVEICAMD